MSDLELPPLKVARRAGRYSRGHEVFEQILRATLLVLIEYGASALTMRRVAVEAGVQPGHLAYYFKSKQDLIRELLDALVEEYIEALEAIAHREGASVEERLDAAIMQIIEDIKTKKTTRVFIELWAMGNHDDFVRDRVETLYQRGYAIFEDLIMELNPKLGPDDCMIVMLFIRSTMEGLQVSAGFGKPWCSTLEPLGRLVVKSLLVTIPALQPGELGRLGAMDGMIAPPRRAK